ncbi:hypothetical protein Hanom_Chr01g00021051 [Helianthus anomalus]
MYHILIWSKQLFWSPSFVHFCHFSPKLKPFASGSLWFQFYYHFGPIINQLIFLKLNHAIVFFSPGEKWSLYIYNLYNIVNCYFSP